MRPVMTSPLPQIAQEWQIADARLPDVSPAVSIFGSARLPATAPEYALAWRGGCRMRALPCSRAADRALWKRQTRARTRAKVRRWG